MKEKELKSFIERITEKYQSEMQQESWLAYCVNTFIDHFQLESKKFNFEDMECSIFYKIVLNNFKWTP